VFDDVARLYLGIAVAFGLALAALDPPFAVGDERTHFLRAYQVSELTILPQREGDLVGGSLPESLARVDSACVEDRRDRASGALTAGRLLELARIPLDPDRRAFLNFKGVAAYPPVPYVPGALAIALGRLAGFGPLALLYCARLANVAAGAAIGWLALRVAPAFRWTLLVAALTPGIVYVMASPSADAVLDALAILVVALVLRLRADRLDPRTAEAGPWTPAARAGAFVACSLLLAFCKPGYGLLPALALVVPPAAPGRRVRQVALVLGLLAVCAAVTALWAAAADETAVMQRPGTSPDPARQLSLVLAEPLRFTRILAESMWHSAPAMAREAYSQFGVADGNLPVGLTAAGWLVLAVVAVADGSRAFALRVREKLVVGAVVLATATGIYVLLYLSQDAPGARSIDGVLGRYFLPVVAPAALLLTNGRCAVLEPDGGTPPSRGQRFARATVTAWVLVAAAATTRAIVAIYWTRG
jgi:uncharacterized membrane protein